MLCQDVKWIEYKFHCLDELENEECDEKIEDYRLRLLLQIIELKEEYRGYFSMPDFEHNLYGSSYLKERIEKVSDSFRILFERSIISDNIGFFYLLLKKHDDAIVKSTQTQRDIQGILFENYIWLIRRTRRINNKQFFEMTFASLEDVIKSLDKEKKISSAFGEKIIQKIEELATQLDSNKSEVILRSISLLFDFGDENESYNFCNKTEKKKLLVRGIFNVGINCVENDYEEGVRMASNALGWMSIQAMKQGVGVLVKYILELAEKMLDISKKMSVSPKTETFLVTLFTTVGMYCYKDPLYTQYKKIVDNAIKNEPIDIIDTAIEIRTYENDMWDSLMDNKTQEYVKSFKKDLNKIKTA